MSNDTTLKSNGQTGEKLLRYLARNGGQATRCRLQKASVLRGAASEYDAVLDSLIELGVIVCENSHANKRDWLYKLAQAPENLGYTEVSGGNGDKPEESATHKLDQAAEAATLIFQPEQLGPGDAPLERQNLIKLLGLEEIGGGIASGQVLITPAIAEILLRGNTYNRPIRKPHLTTLVRAIKNGEWVMTSNGIAFADDGQLIDGQHRLMAIIEAQQPVNSMVHVGISKEAFKTTDLGKKRGAADIAALMGFVNYVTVGCAATLLYLYENNAMRTGYYGVSNTAIEAVLQANRSGLDYSSMIARKAADILPPGIGAFCHYIFSRLDLAMADRFFEHLETGADLPIRSPILWLRNRLLFNRGNKAKLPRLTVAALIIKTWNRFRRGQEAVNLNWLAREQFPKAI